MHIIVDIRSSPTVDSMMTHYATEWVNLWKQYHPTDRISYLHFSHQDCPDNGTSIGVPLSSMWTRPKNLTLPHVHEIFRVVSFSCHKTYNASLPTVIHRWDHKDILYPKIHPSWIQQLWKSVYKSKYHKHHTIIVPSLAIGKEVVEISQVPEESIEIIPYFTLSPGKGERHTLTRYGIQTPFWIYDGGYGSESNIKKLLIGYQTYRETGGQNNLLLLGSCTGMELTLLRQSISDLGLQHSVRIMGLLPQEDIESLYLHAQGWIYVGGYYVGGPRIELARTYHLPMLLPELHTLESYLSASITIHPNHLKQLPEKLHELEKREKSPYPHRDNKSIVQRYEKILAEKK